MWDTFKRPKNAFGYSTTAKPSVPTSGTMGPIAKIAVGEPNPNGGPMPRTGNFPPINTGPFPPGFPFPQPRNFPRPDSPRGGIFAQWLAKWRANHSRS